MNQNRREWRKKLFANCHVGGLHIFQIPHKLRVLKPKINGLKTARHLLDQNLKPPLPFPLVLIQWMPPRGACVFQLCVQRVSFRLVPRGVLLMESWSRFTGKFKEQVVTELVGVFEVGLGEAKGLVGEDERLFGGLKLCRVQGLADVGIDETKLVPEHVLRQKIPSRSSMALQSIKARMETWSPEIVPFGDFTAFSLNSENIKNQQKPHVFRSSTTKRTGKEPSYSTHSFLAPTQLTKRI